jgi:DHA2 family multidrug resistance protein
MAFFFVSVITIQLDGIPPQRVPAATSIANFLRITAGAFSTSIATTVWEDRADLHQSRLAEATSLYDATAQQAVSALHGLGLNDTQTLGVLTRGLVEQSFMLSSLDYFYVTGGLALCVVALVWLTRRPHVASGIAAGGD